MKTRRRDPAAAIAIGVALLVLCSPVATRAADVLKWDRKKGTVQADIENWDLRKLLQRVSASSGWEIYMEPDAQYAVSARFKSKPVNEAISLLLGKMSYALLPRTNGPPTLFVFQSSLQEATQRVAPVTVADDDDTDRVANELIVTLKPGVDIADLARRLGAKVTGRINSLNAYRLEFSDEAAADAAREQLAADNNVLSVEDNFSFPAPSPSQQLAMSSAFPISLKPKVSTDGSRLIIGLVDTAVQRQGSPMEPFLLPGVSVAGSAQPGADQPTHGTAMSNTILRGLAIATDDPDGSPVRILPVDVYGANENTTTFDVALGITAAIKGGATIINLSLGSSGDSGFLKTLISNTHADGVLYVAAAGNEPVATPTYPAAYSEVVAVTAGDRKGNIAPYANRGEFVDVVAPGAAVVPFNGQTYVSYGTSAATAYVAGMAGGLASDRKKTIAQVEADIRKALSIRNPPSP